MSDPIRQSGAFGFFLVALFTAPLIMTPLTAHADGDKVRGKKLFTVCATCHGEKAQGNPDTNAPRLSGQYEWYLERQLLNFRAGARGTAPEDIYGQLMRPMALGLPDDQAVKDVVAYIMTLKAKRYRYAP